MSIHARASIDDSLAPVAFDAPRERANPVSLAKDGAPGAPSPAAALQRRLVTEFDAPERIAGRWSPRRAAVVVIGFNGAFWLATIALLLRL